jgi:hypothetical protein
MTWYQHKFTPIAKTHPATLNVHDRVSWVRTLQDLVFLLAAEHTPGTTDLTEIQNTVREQSLITFI